jgi:putative SOS response-associated peptidase YedK
MCGRYTLTRQKRLVEDLEASLDPDIQKNIWWKARFNVAPTQDAPVVTLREGVRVIEMMRWGLVPFWAGKPGAKPPLMINARVEGLQQKPMFRDALQRRRCLVPADGFFEWAKHGTGKKQTKQPMWIHPGDRHVFAFAGLWARAHTDAGDVRSFAIVTGPPNELVAPIHDRMPVILPRAAWNAWLDPDVPADQARELLGVPPIEDWVAEPVSPWVNAADHDDEQCIAPISAPVPEPPKQGSLF